MLKQLLQLLLNTRTTPEEAAHNAMPSKRYTRLVDNGTIGTEWTDSAFSGIAAYDGYLFFAGTSTSSVPIVGVFAPGVASNLTFPWLGARLSTAIPIAKGAAWVVQGSNLKEVTIDLSETLSLGGGYNHFVRRALPCLRALSNYSQKPSSKARSRGLVSRECRQLRRQLSLQRWTLRGELMSLQQTGTWFFMAERLNVSCITRLAQALIMGASRVSLEDLSRFAKVALCTITSKVRTAPQFSPLLHVSLSNLEKGGSLC